MRAKSRSAMPLVHPDGAQAACRGPSPPLHAETRCPRLDSTRVEHRVSPGAESPPATTSRQRGGAQVPVAYLPIAPLVRSGPEFASWEVNRRRGGAAVSESSGRDSTAAQAHESGGGVAPVPSQRLCFGEACSRCADGLSAATKSMLVGNKYCVYKFLDLPGSFWRSVIQDHYVDFEKMFAPHRLWVRSPLESTFFIPSRHRFVKPSASPQTWSAIYKILCSYVGAYGN
ncbi:hypothetical protein B0H10DRAFT_1154371 [Mycena sp. CBHHK59/15]|nr:hypothetical protein B0H10DRAFT_1154371 [Mycena sp. CBHHK59/15]